MTRYKLHLACGHTLGSDDSQSGSEYCRECQLWPAIERCEAFEDEDV